MQLNEAYELVCVDKEIAEERTRQMEEDIIGQKSIIDGEGILPILMSSALKAQLEVFKAENASAAVGATKSPVMVDLTAQNNKLKGVSEAVAPFSSIRRYSRSKPNTMPSPRNFQLQMTCSTNNVDCVVASLIVFRCDDRGAAPTTRCEDGSAG
jgi:hypothetical protein